MFRNASPAKRTLLQQKADLLHGHSGRCDGTQKRKVKNPWTGEMERVVEPCKMCENAKQYFHSLSPEAISESLEDVPAGEMVNTLAAKVLESFDRRRYHNLAGSPPEPTGRAYRDSSAAMFWLKQYADMGGTL